MKCAGREARMEEINTDRILVRNMKGKDHSIDLGVKCKTILKWNLN
jgi:hypothetical protein